MALFTIGGDWQFNAPDSFGIQVAGFDGLSITPTFIQLGYGEGVGYSHNISSSTVEIYEANVYIEASTGTLTLLSSSGAISEDAPTIDLGTSVCTAWNAGNANCVVSLVGQNFGITANGTFEASGTTGSTYYDAASLDVESPTITLGTNSSITTAISVGNTSSSLTGAFSTVAWASQSGASYTDVTSLNLDSAVLTIGTSLATGINGIIVGNAASGLNVYADNSTWNVSGLLQITATDGLIFTGGSGANIEFNSPQMTFFATNMDFYPTTNLNMGTATAPIFMTGQYVLIQAPGGGFFTIDQYATGGNINIGNTNASQITLANSSCATYLILQTPAGSNSTPLLIDTNGFIHV